MNIDKLKSVLALRHVPVNEAMKGLLLAAGPITKQPSTVAFRVVLVGRETEDVEHPHPFVVWVERFPNFPSLEGSSFSSGEYFLFHDFDKAVQTFGLLIMNGAKFIPSIYRDIDIKEETQ